MNLAFERVLPDEKDKIFVIYEIIKDSGEDMFRTQGLIHWINPYPKESIQKNCEEAEVFLVRDVDTNQYVHTFQLELEFFNKAATINKFATVPQVAGRGIGRKSIAYIENYCRNKGIFKLCLDVYDKSEHAVQFYIKSGFRIVGSKPTRRFTVYLMEKLL